jgi:hypothetical protein
MLALDFGVRDLSAWVGIFHKHVPLSMLAMGADFGLVVEKRAMMCVWVNFKHSTTTGTSTVRLTSSALTSSSDVGNKFGIAYIAVSIEDRNRY